ncbi:hypothetical protein K3217_10275 [bacterium BD-1]|nr:hypothetical protein [Ottowia caeni]
MAARLLSAGTAAWLIPTFGWGETIRAVREWPADEWVGWSGNSLHCAPLSILFWWLMLTLPGWLAWPLFSRLLKPLDGAGFLLVRTLAWLLMGWIAWWLGSLSPRGNTVGHIWAVSIFLVLACTVIAWRQRHQTVAFLRQHWRIVLCGEALFAVALLGFILVRMHNPDLWHPFLGGEKTMEFAYLNSILRSAELPPADPHFSGETINYYYFGLYLVAFLAKLGGFRPEIAFTLAIPTLFALSVLNAYAIALSWFHRSFPSDFGRTARLSLLAPLLVCVLGNPAGFLQFFSGSASGGWNYDFWQPSRVVQGTITEFPYWSFLFGDLHPHVISIPFFLAFLALLLGTLRAQEYQPSLKVLLLPTWVLGALACINPWDLPTAFGLLAVVIFQAGRGLANTRVFLIRVSMALGCLALAWAFFAPFSFQYQPTGVSGLGFVPVPDDPLQWIQVWALPLFVLGSAIFLDGRGHPSVRRALLIAALIALAPAFTGWFVAALSLFLLSLAIVLTGRSSSTDANESFFRLMLVTGLLLLAGLQFVYVRDFLDGSDHYRMNTVFKFSIHAWLLLMLAVSLAWPRVIHLATSAGVLGRLWVLPLAALCIASLVFPLWGTAARMEARIQGAKNLTPTLDALAFMRVSDFKPTPDSASIHLKEDWTAIRWLNEHVLGHALILESSQVDYYRHFGTRIASLTGLSGLNGLHEPEQRDPTRVAARARLHAALWSPRTPQEACALYRGHSIDIVYAGQLERIMHPAMFEQFPGAVQSGCLEPVFTSGSTTIYFTQAFIHHRSALGIVQKSKKTEISDD